MTFTDKIKQTNIVVIVGTVAASVVLALSMSAPTQAHELEPVCHEDEVCWDSQTMGNRISGERDSWERDGGPNLSGARTGFVLVKWANDGARTT